MQGATLHTRQTCAPVQGAPLTQRGHQQRSRRCSWAVHASSDPILKKPEFSSPPKPDTPAADSAAATAPATSASVSGVTVEFQRSQAKEMQKYFRRLDYEEEVRKSQVFGWTKKNEITNGRWVMFGLLVGMLTEYATGVSFIDQLKLMVNDLGIADIE